MKIDESTVEKAYKKLKSSVYFDKTQLILRNAIVEFERTHNDIDGYLCSLFEKLDDDSKFKKLQEEILKSISVSSFPKKLHKDDKSIISNLSSKKITVDKLQYFIDMKIEGHILGVLWIMLIGYQMDKKVYEHSYGNRIRKNLINELSEAPTYSPYLFEPYFVQYESWRDKALSEAQAHMMLDQDVVIITKVRTKYYAIGGLVFDGERPEELRSGTMFCEVKPNYTNEGAFIGSISDAFSAKYEDVWVTISDTSCNDNVVEIYSQLGVKFNFALFGTGTVNQKINFDGMSLFYTEDIKYSHRVSGLNKGIMYHMDILNESELWKQLIIYMGR